MEQLVKTVSCRMEPTVKQAEALRATLEVFANACNFILTVSQENRTTNKVKLQHLCYRDIRQRFGLSANLAIRAIARVAEGAKRKPNKVRVFRPTSVNYDQRIFSYNTEKEMVSLSTVRGRVKCPLVLGNYQRHLLEGQQPTMATLVRRKSKRQWGFYINMVLSRPVPTPRGTHPVGVDLGINNLATSSNGLRFSGKQAMHIRRRYAGLRASLQAKGTKGARGLLGRLSGRESRTIRLINHTISRRIVNACQAGDVLVLEDLKHIRERTRTRKGQRYIHQSWPFAQLQRFLEYKALERGIPVAYVDPRGSSHTCPRCRAPAVRQGHDFRCPSCGYSNHADFAASYELANRGRALLAGLPVSQPQIAASAGESPWL
jgi:IS605 OrfB family transposase